VRCPHSRQGGVLAGGDGVVTDGGGALTGGLLCYTSGVSSLLLTVVSSPIFPHGALPRGGGGICTSGSVTGSRRGGVRLGAGGCGRTSVDGSGLACFTKSSARGMTTSYSGACRRRPHVVVCLMGSNNGGLLLPHLGWPNTASSGLHSG